MAIQEIKKNTKSAKEIKIYTDEQIAKFAKTKDALSLLDLTKNENRTFTIFSKDKLRTYMQNPKSNESNLRALSQFLYRMSHQYRRLVHYYAEMIDLTAYSVIPIHNITEENDVDSIKQQYYDTCVQVEKMNMPSQIMQALISAWRDGVFYGYVYEDDSGFFILPLDGSYCKVSSVNFDGSLNFAFNFSYFRSNSQFLEYWDKEFTTKYNAYTGDNTLQWQELDPARTICLKVDIDDKTMSIPPFVSLFEQIIDLIDLQSIQSIKDELSIYKLIVAHMETNPNTNEADDFLVDIDTAIAYYDRLAEALPDNVNSVLSPLPLDSIEFKGSDTSDVDMISNSMSNLFKSAGVAQILDNTNITGQTAFEASILCDSLMAMKILLPQTEVWVNRYLTYTMGDHASVKYVEVTPYTKSKKIKEVTEAATYGAPVKLMLATLQGYSPLEVMSMQFLENDVFQLHNNWIPLMSSHTTSGSDTGGAPEKDELTDEGAKTKDKSKNNS